MRVFSLRTALCLTLLTLATTAAFAGVRGKPTTLKPVGARNPHIAQNDADYFINAVPVPADANVTGEGVLHEAKTHPTMTANDPNRVNTAPTAARTNHVAVSIMMTPMMALPAQPMPMILAPGYAACGGIYGGFSPVDAAAYYYASGPGLYRTWAEAGLCHFPYYSYRRPWYFPGQPSFHRSIDYVW